MNLLYYLQEINKYMAMNNLQLTKINTQNTYLRGMAECAIHLTDSKTTSDTHTGPILTFTVSGNIAEISHFLFKPGACGRRVPGFLKLLLSGKSVCVCECGCVCVRPQGYEKLPIKQVLVLFSLLYGTCYRYN